MQFECTVPGDCPVEMILATAVPPMWMMYAVRASGCGAWSGLGRAAAARRGVVAPGSSAYPEADTTCMVGSPPRRECRCTFLLRDGARLGTAPHRDTRLAFVSDPMLSGAVFNEVVSSTASGYPVP